MTNISQLTNTELNHEIGKALGYKFNVEGVRKDLVVSPSGAKVELPNWSGEVGEAFKLICSVIDYKNINMPRYWKWKFSYSLGGIMVVLTNAEDRIVEEFDRNGSNARALAEMVVEIFRSENQ